MIFIIHLGAELGPGKTQMIVDDFVCFCFISLCLWNDDWFIQENAERVESTQDQIMLNVN